MLDDLIMEDFSALEELIQSGTSSAFSLDVEGDTSSD